MKLVIDRKRWLRGVDVPQSTLRNSEGHMCCLGFFGLACGIAAEDLLDNACPSDLPDKGWPPWLLTSSTHDEEDGYEVTRIKDSAAGSDLMEVNDGHYDEEPKREALIAELFAKHGVEVEFTNE
jgi:hypothetical protein